MAGLVAVFQSNLQALLGYRPGPVRRRGLILPLRSAELRLRRSVRPAEGASRPGKFASFPIGGDHLTMLRPPHLEGLAGAIVAQLGDD